MRFSNSPFAKLVSNTYQNTKDVLGNAAVQKKVAKGQSRANEDLAKVDGKLTDLQLRQKLGVDKQTYKRIVAGGTGYVAPDIKNATRLYDRSLAGGGNFAKSFDSQALMALFRAYGQVSHDDGNQQALDGQIRQNVLLHLQNHLATSPLSDAEKKLAATLAGGLLERLSFDSRAGHEVDRPNLSAKDLVEHQKARKNGVRKALARGLEKAKVGLELVEKRGEKVALKAQRATRAAAGHTYNAATSAVAGTTVGLLTASAGALSPAGLALLVGYRAAEGVTSGTVAAGQTMGTGILKDAKALANQFVAADGRQSGMRRNASGGSGSSATLVDAPLTEASAYAQGVRDGSAAADARSTRSNGSVRSGRTGAATDGSTRTVRPSVGDDDRRSIASSSASDGRTITPNDVRDPARSARSTRSSAASVSSQSSGSSSVASSSASVRTVRPGPAQTTNAAADTVAVAPAPRRGR